MIMTKVLSGGKATLAEVCTLTSALLASVDLHRHLYFYHFKCACVSAKAQMRLTLFYLCNEIVQTCKRKHATAFKDSFKEVMLEATTLVR